MNDTTKRLIWTPTIVLVNAAVWYSMQGMNPLTILVASLFASFVAREIVGTIFYFDRIRRNQTPDDIEAGDITPDISPRSTSDPR